MQTMNEVFDATQIAPSQGGGKHKVGNKWAGAIVGAKIEETKDKSGGMYVVTFASDGGQIDFRYNLWNQSEQARNIARGQLSALCHAIGIFQINFANGGQNIINAKLMYDVGFQAGNEPTQEKPEGGYVEVKRVYDMNGNDPGSKSGGHQQQPQGGNAGGQQWNGGGQQTNQPQTNGPATGGPAAGGQAWQGGGQAQNAQQSQPQGGWQQGSNGPSGGGAPWKNG